ncbi:hypothetical protein [Synechococcus sp. UW105]|uniref:hypothetical protein n=1 Tax=Synechococcus sp. UW105 TaxID=337067 RepID=UPI0010BD5846|nr:hypothetical protein [Synechococcus sp. UW105]
MGALLYHPALIHHQDEIGISDRARWVGHDCLGAVLDTLIRLIEVFPDPQALRLVLMPYRQLMRSVKSKALI